MSAQDKGLAEIAKSLRLEAIYTSRPELIRAAFQNAQAMSERLDRSHAPSDEPSHIFRVDNNA